MNKAQRLVILLATLAALGMGAVPPWYFHYNDDYAAKRRRAGEGAYGFILRPPHGEHHTARIDVHRFGVQMVTLLAVSTGLYVLLGSRHGGSSGRAPKPGGGGGSGGTGDDSDAETTTAAVIPRTYVVLGTLLSAAVVAGALWLVTSYGAYFMLALLILATWAAWEVEG